MIAARIVATAALHRRAPSPLQRLVAEMNANKPEGSPVVEARRQIPELTAFVIANDIVTIPDKEKALVEESPP